MRETLPLGMPRPIGASLTLLRAWEFARMVKPPVVVRHEAVSDYGRRNLCYNAVAKS